MPTQSIYKSLPVACVVCGFLFTSSSLFTSIALPAFSQTQAEIEQVTNLTRRAQTNASTLTFVASLAESKGDNKKALDSYNKLLGIYKIDPGIGPGSAKCAWILSKIALCQNKIEQKQEAAKTCKEALAIIEGQSPENNPAEGNYVIMTRQNCSIVLGKDMPPPAPPKKPEPQLKTIPQSDISDLNAQEKRTSELFSSLQKKEPASDKTVNCELYLANLYTLQKKNQDAEPHFKKVIAALEKKHGKKSANLLTALSNYGYMLKQAGREKEAQDIVNRMKQLDANAK